MARILLIEDTDSLREETRFILEMERVAPFFMEELIEVGYRDFFCQIRGSDYNGVSLEAFRRHLGNPKCGENRLQQHRLFARIPRDFQGESTLVIVQFKSKPGELGGV